MGLGNCASEPVSRRLCKLGVTGGGGSHNHMRFIETRKAATFFLACLHANAPMVAVENPTMFRQAQHMIGAPPAFAVHPHMFGDGYSKRTCFWTRGLPPLLANGAMAYPPLLVHTRKSHRSDISATNATDRQRTPSGMAAAMAKQWGSYAMTILDRVPNKRALAVALFPNGKVYDASGRMHVGDWDGNPGQSCVVYLDQGRLYDFNGAQRGDLVDVIMHQQHCDATGARDWLDRGKWLRGDAYHAKDMPAPRPTLHLIDLPAAPPRTPLPEPGANGVVYVYRWADGSIAMLVRTLAWQRWAKGYPAPAVGRGRMGCPNRDRLSRFESPVVVVV